MTPNRAAAGPLKRGGSQPLSTYADQIGFPQGFSTRIGGLDHPAYISAVKWMQTKRPSRQNFWPALVLAFISQSEEALKTIEKESVTDPFSLPIEKTTTSGRVVNTLNFKLPKNKITLRPRFNNAAQVIRVDMRRDHPSAAPHATQAWRQYRELVTLIFQMSPAARTRFAEYIWKKGVIDAEERRWASTAGRIVRPFERVLADFDTRNAKPGGALFQALVYGYFSADSPNLTLESHSVNTGSSHVDMPGDVAGFRGGEVELAVEVKDYEITSDTVEAVLVDFLEDLVNAPNTTAVVVADSVDVPSRKRLAQSNVIALSREDLRIRVMTWDLPKQQEALRAALYFLSRVQKTTTLVHRLETYLTEKGLASGILDQTSEQDSSTPVNN